MVLNHVSIRIFSHQQLRTNHRLSRDKELVTQSGGRELPRAEHWPTLSPHLHHSDTSTPSHQVPGNIVILFIKIIKYWSQIWLTKSNSKTILTVVLVVFLTRLWKKRLIVLNSTHNLNKPLQRYQNNCLGIMLIALDMFWSAENYFSWV